MAETFDVDAQHPVRGTSDLGPAGTKGEAHVAAPLMSGRPETHALGSEAPKTEQSKRHALVAAGTRGTTRAPR